MLYRVIGLMSGSSLDGLDIAFVQFEETAGKWSFEIIETSCIQYSREWKNKLRDFSSLTAKDYLILHTEFGRYIGQTVQQFIDEKNLTFRVQLISSHGHTSFHLPAFGMTAQLGSGAHIASTTGISTITDLRAVDVSLGGQGAPVVPIGEKILFPDYPLFLNIGGIANISAHYEKVVGLDVCPANRVLNMLASDNEKGFDEDGHLAASGKIDAKLLQLLNELDYYKASFPKSLSNDFGVLEVFPVIQKANLSREDALRTYVQHIVDQISSAVGRIIVDKVTQQQMLITGGGAFNIFLVDTLRGSLKKLGIDCMVPDKKIVEYKEALIIALMGALRWREEENVLHTVTGASRDSINGALWTS